MLLKLKTVKQLASSLVIAVVATATADTINVPEDFLTIQEALDVAIEGDEILVDQVHTTKHSYLMAMGYNYAVYLARRSP